MQQKLRIENGKYFLNEVELITKPQGKHGRCAGCYGQYLACGTAGMRKVCNGNGVIFVEKRRGAWWIVWLIAGLSGLAAFVLERVMKP